MEPNGSATNEQYDLAAVGPAELATLAEPLERLYRKCFSEPPWHEGEERFERFGQRFADHLATPGTHGIVARQADEVAGVIYGWPAAPEIPKTPFYANVYGAVDPADHHLLRPPSLEIVELMVDPDHQGRGLGRELLTRLVEPHPQAWLCTRPDAPARKLYESEGWTVLGDYRNEDKTLLIVMSLRSRR
jgi:ribosomal protein S18 acetylase RimI-like enzyme